MRELTRDEVRDLLGRPEALLAVWPDATGERLDVIVPRHLEREGFRFVAEWEDDGALAGIAYGYRGAYLCRGWEVVVPEIDFGADYPPFLVMGRRLPL